MEDAPGITCRGTRGSLWTVGGLEPLFLRARGRWTQVRARRSLVGGRLFFGCCQLHPQLEPAGGVGGKGCNLQEQNAQPVREHGSHGKHDGASRVTNHGRHVAAQTPPPPLPPPGHLARAPASPPPRAVCSKLRWFFSRQQVLSGLPFAMAARHHHGHSPIPFERCGAWWPPSPPLAKANVTPALSQHTSAAVVVLLSLSPSQQCCARQH